MDILPGKMFNIYITQLTARPLKLPKLKVLANVSSLPTCIIHMQDDESYVRKNRGHASKPWNSVSNDPTVNVICFKPQERWDEQVDFHSTVKPIVENSQTD